MKVLILGGSEFMGRQLVLDLLSTNEYIIYTINRGKTYWNSSTKTFHGLHHFHGDRNVYLEFQKLLLYVSERAGITRERKWDLVVDFSCYERKHMKSAVRGLKGLCRLFVYISTDSVYEVCDRRIRREDFVREEYAVRPVNDNLIAELNEEDQYGNDKLRCEEYLRSHEKDLGFDYLCLRLPDVIGPFDTSGRFWAYLIWLGKSKENPIHLNKNFEIRKISFVYSKDVSRLLVSFLGKLKDEKSAEFWLSKISGESFNVCFDETLTLKSLLEKMGALINLDKVNFVDEKKLVKAGKFFYPSVECGPLNNSKSKLLLEFKPTSLDVAVEETVDFFVNNCQDYFVEGKKANEKFMKAVSVPKIEHK